MPTVNHLPDGWKDLDDHERREWAEAQPLLRGALRLTYPGRENEAVCRLYRYYDDAGDLLYIGITHSISTRDTAHCRSSRWRHLASMILVETYPSQRVAEAAEAQAIEDEKPPENRKWPAARWDEDDPVPYRWWRKGRVGYRGDEPTWAVVSSGYPCWWPPRLIAPPPLTPSHLSLLARLEAQRAHDAGRGRA